MRHQLLSILFLGLLPCTLRAQQIDTLDTTIRQIGQVSVTAHRSMASGIVTPASLERMPAVLGERDVMKYLATLPGVITTSALDPGIYVRGGGGDENACYVNGQPIISPEHLTGILSTFDPFVLGRSTIYKSGFPARYNGSLASYLNLLPVTHADSLCQGEVEAGMLSSALRLRLANRKGMVVSASARLSYLQYITRLYNSVDKRNNIPDYAYNDYTASLHTPLGKHLSLDLFGLYSSDKLRLDQGALPLRWHTYTANARLGWKDSSYQLALKAGVRGKKSRGSSVQDYIMAYDNENLFITAGLEYGVALGNSWELSVGADFESASLHTDYNDKNTGADTYTLWSGWLGVSGRIGNSLYADGGINLQYYNGADGFFTAAPRIRLRYSPARWNIWIDYARTTQYTVLLPVLNSRSPLDILRPLDPGQTPTGCDQLSAGADREFGRGWYLYAALFYKKMHHAKEFANQMLSTTTTLQGLQIDGSGEAWGVELQLAYDRDAWHAQISYTLSDSWRRFDQINDGKRFRPPFDVRHNVRATLSWQPAPRWNIGLMWSYQSGTYTTFPVGVGIAQDIHNPENNPLFVPIYKERYNFRMPATHRLDIDISYTHPWQRLSMAVHAGLYNVYNQANASYVQFRVETRETYYTRFVPQARVLLPMIPYLSLSLQW